VRLLVYNIRYATGTGPAFHLPVPGAGYLRSSRRVLEQITQFIRSEDPDVVGLIEVDTGSVRTGMVNQATYMCQRPGPLHRLPVQVRHRFHQSSWCRSCASRQCAAGRPRVTGERFHYFDTGIKRLIIELELDEVCVFLVHLSLKFRHRQYQLRTLHDLVVARPSR
jgi:endonuclease/exonuclease/phosphatase family metal-dependent hydrolase